MATTTTMKALTVDNINQHVRSAQYAVRGEIATRAETYRAQLKSAHDPPTPPSDSNKPLPFDTVISANIGNPQQLDQKPITFFRQVLSILENPALLSNEAALQSAFNYPSDVIDRAKRLLAEVKSVGAYSQSQGAPGIRDSVAKFIEKRDGFPSDPSTIFLSAGASSGVNTLMNVICSKPETGILVPIPQYPLYTATLSLLNARCVPYYLDEASGWSTNMSAIQDAYTKAKDQGTDIRAIVVINPGNPTGGCLPADAVADVLRFAADKNLVVMADEVYQTNVFIGEFTSFKKSLRQLQQSSSSSPSEKEKLDNLELASLNSISKGMVGECGHRGGYFELTGFSPDVAAQIYKFVSIMLCPPERATALYEAFKGMEGVECQKPQGSMYLYPTIKLPPKAIEEAERKGKKPDEFYCGRLLDATGVCVVAGSGFGQKEGTLHFRTTFLAPGTEWVGRIGKFHEGFMEEFR
ncbi:MAG: alanine transaminase [Ramalina farinacea]|uniref:Alanine transaminase n=1 Tax=Ramalina farinacea TaxID=258253 RepID=A0AA43TVI0_9LECA|nr:alanine transaminase [Ramalina farinacea]